MSWQSMPLPARGYRAAAAAGRETRPPARSARRARRRATAERRGEPASMRPPRPVRRGDVADLARDQPQPPAVERLAERRRHLGCAVPAQLDDGRLVAGEPQRRREARGRRTRMENDVAIGRAHRTAARSRPRARLRSPRAGSMSTRVTSRSGSLPHSHAHSAPTTPPPTTAMRSAGPGAASHTALSAVSMLAASTPRDAGTSAGSSVTASAGRLNAVWCG